MENIKRINQELKEIENNVNELTRDFINDYLSLDNNHYGEDDARDYLFDYKSIYYYDIDNLFNEGGYQYEEDAQNEFGNFETITDGKRNANYLYLYSEVFNGDDCLKYVELLEKLHEYKQEKNDSQEVA